MLTVPVHAAEEKGIFIDRANGLIIDGIYQVDAAITYQLSEEAVNALVHGISLQIDIELRVEWQRPWVWDKTVTSKILSYRLEHHPLSGHYLVTNLESGNRDQFQSLAGALYSIGEIRKLPLVDENQLQDGRDYKAVIMAHLNKQALPAPLRPLAYLSSRWHITSRKHTWAIQ